MFWSYQSFPSWLVRLRAGDESSNNEKKTEESGHGGLGDGKLASFELCKIPVRLESGPNLIPLSGSNDLANIDWRLFLDRSISGQSEKVSATHRGKFVFSVILFFLSVKKAADGGNHSVWERCLCKCFGVCCYFKFPVSTQPFDASRWYIVRYISDYSRVTWVRTLSIISNRSSVTMGGWSWSQLTSGEWPCTPQPPLHLSSNSPVVSIWHPANETRQ